MVDVRGYEDVERAGGMIRRVELPAEAVFARADVVDPFVGASSEGAVAVHIGSFELGLLFEFGVVDGEVFGAVDDRGAPRPASDMEADAATSVVVPGEPAQVRRRGDGERRNGERDDSDQPGEDGEKQMASFHSLTAPVAGAPGVIARH